MLMKRVINSLREETLSHLCRAVGGAGIDRLSELTELHGQLGLETFVLAPQLLHIGLREPKERHKVMPQWCVTSGLFVGMEMIFRVENLAAATPRIIVFLFRHATDDTCRLPKPR